MRQSNHAIESERYPMQPIMVQGTSTHCGKTTLVAGLCRLFASRGLKVAPFKSQNMSLNSYVTESGEEIARATAVQARGARQVPNVHMNPILLKAKSDDTCQLIVHGEVVRDVSAKEYFLSDELQDLKLTAIRKSIDMLNTEYDLIIAEGAGSCAEPNLRALDVVNMGVAHELNARVFIVGDIDAGGVFAEFLGTRQVLDLTQPEDVKLVEGFVINKWRGDRDVLQPGIEFLSQHCDIPVVAVLPFLHDLTIEEEDRLAIVKCENPEVRIALLYLPHISNATDFELLARMPNVEVRPVRSVGDLVASDAIIIPGTKNTTWDLDYLRRTGIERAIIELAEDTLIFGVCGGYQMLARELRDPLKCESEVGTIKGMNLLDLTVEFEPKKTVLQRTYRPSRWNPFLKTDSILGYEIHSGRLAVKPMRPLFEFDGGQDGAVHPEKAIFGTFVHDLFRNPQFVQAFVNSIRVRKGLPRIDTAPLAPEDTLNSNVDRLAEVIRGNWDI